VHPSFLVILCVHVKCVWHRLCPQNASFVITMALTSTLDTELNVDNVTVYSGPAAGVMTNVLQLSGTTPVSPAVRATGCTSTTSVCFLPGSLRLCICVSVSAK
jgi:hypothetical protein